MRKEHRIEHLSLPQTCLDLVRAIRGLQPRVVLGHPTHKTFGTRFKIHEARSGKTLRRGKTHPCVTRPVSGGVVQCGRRCPYPIARHVAATVFPFNLCELSTRTLVLFANSGRVSPCHSSHLSCNMNMLYSSSMVPVQNFYRSMCKCIVSGLDRERLPTGHQRDIISIVLHPSLFLIRGDASSSSNIA